MNRALVRGWILSTIIIICDLEQNILFQKREKCEWIGGYAWKRMAMERVRHFILVHMRWKMTKWLYGWIGLSIFRNFLVFFHFACAAVDYYYYFLSCFCSAMFILLLIDELTRIVDFSSVLIHNKQRLEKKTQNSNVRKSRNQLKDWREWDWASERYVKWNEKEKNKELTFDEYRIYKRQYSTISSKWPGCCTPSFILIAFNNTETERKPNIALTFSCMAETM